MEIIRMNRFTNKLAIAAALTIYFTQFVAFASDINNDFDGAESPLKKLSIVQAPATTTLGNVVKQNKIQFLTLAASYENTDPRNLRLVCREWRNIIDGLINKKDKNRKYSDQHPIWQKIIRISYVGLGHDAIWKTILNGELLYKPNGHPKSDSDSDEPNPDSDVGMVRLKISDLANPFAGTFDLSQCGEASKHLSISMGLRKGKNDENQNKTEIWLIPRLLAIKNLEGNASYLKEIMDSWDEDVTLGVTFNWWEWDHTSNYHMYESPNWNWFHDDYLESLSQNDLNSLYLMAVSNDVLYHDHRIWRRTKCDCAYKRQSSHAKMLERFQVSFISSPKSRLSLLSEE
jgi:hypothetical protein